MSVILRFQRIFICYNIHLVWINVLRLYRSCPIIVLHAVGRVLFCIPLYIVPLWPGHTAYNIILRTYTSRFSCSLYIKRRQSVGSVTSNAHNITASILGPYLRDRVRDAPERLPKLNFTEFGRTSKKPTLLF